QGSRLFRRLIQKEMQPNTTLWTAFQLNHVPRYKVVKGIFVSQTLQGFSRVLLSRLFCFQVFLQTLRSKRAKFERI
ncbi:MAG: hypothetical protein QXR76_01805, partial [Candidatus Bathyarchaeia archaeon]